MGWGLQVPPAWPARKTAFSAGFHDSSHSAHSQPSSGGNRVSGQGETHAGHSHSGCGVSGALATVVVLVGPGSGHGMANGSMCTRETSLFILLHILQVAVALICSQAATRARVTGVAERRRYSYRLMGRVRGVAGGGGGWRWRRVRPAAHGGYPQAANPLRAHVWIR